MEQTTKEAAPSTEAKKSQASWLREYETIYLLPPETSDEASDKLAERLRELVAKNGGRVVKFTTWGRRKTAFEVRRQLRALYVHMAFLGTGKVRRRGRAKPPQHRGGRKVHHGGRQSPRRSREPAHRARRQAFG